MNRDEAKKVLGENATEEQITYFLNNFHNYQSEKLKTLEKENTELKSNQERFNDYDKIKQELNEKKQAEMTEAEKLAIDKEITAKKLREANILLNKVKAKQELSEYNVDEETLETIVTDDENLTLANAKRLKDNFDRIKEETAKLTKEQLSTTDLKPSITNVNQSDEVMNFEKFSKLSAEEQEKFIAEHPEEFEKF